MSPPNNITTSERSLDISFQYYSMSKQ